MIFERGESYECFVWKWGSGLCIIGTYSRQADNLSIDW